MRTQTKPPVIHPAISVGGIHPQAVARNTARQLRRYATYEAPTPAAAAAARAAARDAEKSYKSLRLAELAARGEKS